MNVIASEAKPNQLILFRKGGGSTTFPARDPAIMITEEEKREITNPGWGSSRDHSPPSPLLPISSFPCSHKQGGDPGNYSPSLLFAFVNLLLSCISPPGTDDGLLPPPPSDIGEREATAGKKRKEEEEEEGLFLFLRPHFIDQAFVVLTDEGGDFLRTDGRDSSPSSILFLSRPG